MTSKAIAGTELDYVSSFLDVQVSSTSLQDFCKRLVHSDFSRGLVTGTAIYYLNDESQLVMCATYGPAASGLEKEISLWGESVIAGAVKDMRFAVENLGSGEAMILPLMFAGMPNGVLVMNLSERNGLVEFVTGIASILGRMVGHFVQMHGIGPSASTASRRGSVQADISEITSRQITILELMAEGLTNAEIAQQVLMSESTVRQETVRIYRMMGVHSRAEAISMGRAMGLIQNLISTPPRKI